MGRPRKSFTELELSGSLRDHPGRYRERFAPATVVNDSTETGPWAELKARWDDWLDDQPDAGSVHWKFTAKFEPTANTTDAGKGRKTE